LSSGNVDITGLDKNEVLAALYNRSRPQGMGFLHYDAKPWTAEDARKYIEQTLEHFSTIGYSSANAYSFDYVNGRVLKVNIADDTFSPHMYDRDNGAGAAQEVIDTLIHSGEVAAQDILAGHRESTVQALAEARQGRETQPTTQSGAGFRTFTLSLSDVPELDERLDRAASKLFGNG
jgi:hypothetical protein